MPTLIRLTPIRVMTMPVTSGVITRRRWPRKRLRTICTKAPKKPARLDQGAGAGNHQRHADQVRQVLAEAEQRADHQRRSDDADEAGQHVCKKLSR
ncbi:hypothetical protein RLJV_23540 [Pseudomonas aeruginosa]|nr:hypothetical protein RLJV_23540 [Pseudomonas aeruginosa]